KASEASPPSGGATPPASSAPGSVGGALVPYGGGGGPLVPFGGGPGGPLSLPLLGYRPAQGGPLVQDEVAAPQRPRVVVVGSTVNSGPTIYAKSRATATYDERNPEEAAYQKQTLDDAKRAARAARPAFNGDPLERRQALRALGVPLSDLVSPPGP